MPLYYPDILKHENSNYAIVDLNDIRGISIINSTSDFYTIPIDKRKIGFIISIIGNAIYQYNGINVDDINWNSISNWTPFNPTIDDNTIKSYDTILNISHICGENQKFIACTETGLIYKYVYDGSTYTIDNYLILATKDGGDSRYIYVDYENTNKADKIIDVTDADLISLLTVDQNGQYITSNVLYASDSSQLKTALESNIASHIIVTNQFVVYGSIIIGSSGHTISGSIIEFSSDVVITNSTNDNIYLIIDSTLNCGGNVSYNSAYIFDIFVKNQIGSPNYIQLSSRTFYIHITNNSSIITVSGGASYNVNDSNYWIPTIPVNRSIIANDTIGSIVGGGNLESDITLSLKNDSINPGNGKYYGTDNVGVKGYNDPSNLIFSSVNFSDDSNMFYDPEYITNTIELPDGTRLQLGQEEHYFLYNDTGVEIPEGKLLYFTGANSDGIGKIVQSCALAKADNISTARVKCMSTTVIPVGGYGKGTKRGDVNGLDTSASGNQGDIIYLSYTTAGWFTNILPTSPNIAIEVGRILKVDNTTGSVYCEPCSLDLGHNSSVTGNTNFFLTNDTSSTEPTYKQLNKNNTAGETTTTIVTNDNEVLGTQHICDTPLGVTTIPSGQWQTNFTAKVSATAGVTRLKLEYHLYHIGGTNTKLFEVYSNSLENTVDELVIMSYSTSQLSCLDTDKLMVRVYGTTTSTSNKTITYYLGDGRSAFISIPLQISHVDLSNVNGNPEVQHMNSSIKSFIDTFKTTFDNATNDFYFRKVSGQIAFEAVSGGASIANPIVWVNATLGDDVTGARGDQNKPLLTPEAARDAAQSGDTIYVHTGTYTITTTAANGLSKDGVQWFLPYGAIFNKATSGHIFNNAADFVLPSNVYGWGTFNKMTTNGYIYSTFHASESFTAEFNAYKITGDVNQASLIGANGGLYSSVTINVEWATSVNNIYTGYGKNIVINFNNWLSTAGWGIYNNSSNPNSYSTITGNVIESLTTNAIQFNTGSNVYININRILGVTYGIVNGGHFASMITVNCSYCTGISTSGGRFIFNGNGKNLLTVDDFYGGRFQNITVTGGTCTTTLWNSASFGNLATLTVSGGVINLTQEACTYSYSWNLTGGIVNVKNFTPTGTNYGSHIIAGAEVHIYTRMNGIIGVDGAGAVLVINSGKLYIHNILQNGVQGSATNEAYYGGIEWNGGKLVIDGGGIVLTSTKALPIRATVPNLQLRVPTVYATNRVINNIAGIHKKSKLTITAIATTSITLNDGAAEVFVEADTATYDTKAKLAQRMAALINASATLDITASQDIAGTDDYLWIISDNYYDYAETSLVNITSILESMNSYPYTEIAGGTINENINVE